MRKKSERGSTMIETALSLLVLMPLLMGTSVVGVNLVRAIQVHQFARDVGHMYAYGTIDPSKSGGQNLLVHLAQGLNVQTTGGDGAVIFSNITMVEDTDCVAAGLTANTSSCPNLHQPVITRRVVVGNASKLTSRFGTPTGTGVLGTDGYISPANYLTNSSCRARNFAGIMTVNAGQFAYITEAYVAAPDIDWRGFMSGTGSYAYYVF